MSASVIGGGTERLRANPSCVGERSLPRIFEQVAKVTSQVLLRTE